MESIYAPTQQVSPDDYLEKMRLAEIESKRVQRQFGGKSSASPIGISYNDKRQGLNKYVVNDMDRRTTALGNASELAKSIDNRNTEVVRQTDALDLKENLLAQDVANQQSNDLRENDLQTLARGQSIQKAGRQIAFKSMQNRDSRNDAVIDVYKKGEMQEELTKAANTHGIAMQDIDTMFNKIMADLDNNFKDYELSGRVNNQKLLDDLGIKAANNAAIINGVTQTVGEVAKRYEPSESVTPPPDTAAPGSDPLFSQETVGATA